MGKNVKIIFLTGLVRFFQRWGHSWPTGFNGGVATPGSHLDPLHGAVYCARALVPFHNITAGGVLVALPRQREASVCINCSGSGNGFLVWENDKSAETKHFFEFLGQTVQRQSEGSATVENHPSSLFLCYENPKNKILHISTLEKNSPSSPVPCANIPSSSSVFIQFLSGRTCPV